MKAQKHDVFMCLVPPPPLYVAYHSHTVYYSGTPLKRTPLK